jgi:hypothetical protein
MMLAPPMVKLVPSTPMFLSPLPDRPCHWMPNSAAYVGVDFGDQAFYIDLGARASSRSMTARIWRYCGSGAVMISELVAGSAMDLAAGGRLRRG